MKKAAAPRLKLTVRQRVAILRILGESFTRQVRQLRARQLRLVAKALEAVDREKAEKLLKKI